MDSLSRRTKNRFGRMINSAVSVINNGTLRRRSNFARSATTNSYGPIPIDGDSSVPLMYSSQRSNSTTSSTNSIGSIPGFGVGVGGSNLIHVRSLEQSVENDLNVNVGENKKGVICSTQQAIPRPAPSVGSAISILHGFVKIAEYMYITDNKELLDGDRLDAVGISHVISVGKDLPAVVSVTKKEGLLLITPLTLHHETDVNPNQTFKNLSSKFDNLNLFIENARRVFQKIVIYCKNKVLAYFVAAQYNIDYYELEPEKALNHLMKVAGAEWVDLPDRCVKRLAEWRELGKKRREERGAADRRLSLSINCVQKQ